MNTVNMNVAVDLSHSALIPTIRVKQYDQNGRVIKLFLYNNFTAYTPGSTVSAIVEGTKPDGLAITNDATISGSTVLVTITEQMTAVTGTYKLDMVLIDGTARVGQAAVRLHVDAAAVQDMTMESTSEYLALLNALSKTNSFETRLNNIVASAGTSNTEIVDARIGADGTTYDTAGNAIRGQISKLNETLKASTLHVDFTSKSSNFVVKNINVRKGDQIKLWIDNITISRDLTSNAAISIFNTTCALNYIASTKKWDRTEIECISDADYSSGYMSFGFASSTDAGKITCDVHLQVGITKEKIEDLITSGETVDFTSKSSGFTVKNINVRKGDKIKLWIDNITISSDLTSNAAISILNTTGALNYIASTKKWDRTEIECISDADQVAIRMSFGFASSTDAGKITCDVHLQYRFGTRFLYEKIDAINTEVNQGIGLIGAGTVSALGNYFIGSGSKLNITNAIATLDNTIMTEDNLIRKISIKSLNSGKIRFGIGYIDQRGWAIVENHFDKEVIAGENVFDMTAEGIQIKKGKRLFVYDDYFNPGTEMLSFNRNANNDQKKYEIIYGYVDGALSRAPVTYGFGISLRYEVCPINSSFPLKGEIEDLNNAVSQNTSSISSLVNLKNVVYDNSGNAYKLIVVNGNLSIRSMNYSKVTVLGNSWSYHPTLYSSGWCAERGMAASVDGNDFVSILRNGIVKKNSSATLSVLNVAEWERDWSKMSIADDYLTSETDLVVFRVGENITTTVGYETAIENYVDFVRNKSPKADVLLCATGLSGERLTATIKASTAKNTMYAYCEWVSSKYSQPNGSYTMGWVTNDSGVTWDKTQTKLWAITNSAVAGHPSDVGMLAIANSILKAMKYDEITKIVHNINVSNPNSHTYSCPDQWLKNGIVSLHLTGETSVAAVDASSSSIALTNHNDGVYTFIMPDSDVSITIT